MREFEVITNTEEKLAENRRRKSVHKKYRMILAGVLAVVLIFTGIAYYYRDFTDYAEVTELISNETNKDIKPYLDGVVQYNSKGIAYYKENNKLGWKRKIPMKDPIVKICEEYMIAYERQESKIHVIDKQGNIDTVVTSYPIVEAEVTKNGLIAVVLNNKEISYIDIYNKQGESLVNSKTTLEGQGYPLDIDIDSTGERLCASNFVLQGVTKKNQINFFDYSDRGSANGNIMASYEYENTLVPTVAFLGDDTVCAFGDNKISVYNMIRKPNLRKEIPIDVTIRSIAYDDDHFAIVREHTADETEGNYIMEIFSRNGNCIGSVGIEDEYSSLQIYGNRIVLNSAYQCKIYTLKGRKIFDHTFKKQIIRICPTTKNDKYYIAYEDEVDIIKLK